MIGKFNLGEKMEDSKVVRKILRSLPESFRAKVTAIEESKGLDEIKIQELIDSLQTYELFCFIGFLGYEVIFVIFMV